MTQYGTRKYYTAKLPRVVVVLFRYLLNLTSKADWMRLEIRTRINVLLSGEQKNANQKQFKTSAFTYYTKKSSLGQKKNKRISI